MEDSYARLAKFAKLTNIKMEDSYAKLAKLTNIKMDEVDRVFKSITYPKNLSPIIHYICLMEEAKELMKRIKTKYT